MKRYSFDSTEEQGIMTLYYLSSIITKNPKFFKHLKTKLGVEGRGLP